MVPMPDPGPADIGDLRRRESARKDNGKGGSRLPAGLAWSDSATPKAILSLAFPALGALAAEPLFLLADTAIVSHLGTRPLAGFGTAAAALSTLVNVCIFLAYGTTATTSRRLGAGDFTGAVQAGVNGVALAAGLGTMLGITGLAAAPQIVRVVGVTPVAAGYAATYLRASALGLPSMLVVLAGTGLLRGLANTRTPLLIAAGGAAANIGLNYLLVYPAGLGIAGSGLGTAITQTGMALCYLMAIRAMAARYGVRPVPSLRGIRESLGGNVALLLRTVALRVYLLVAVWVAGRIGTVGLAAYTVSFNAWTLLAFCLDALAIAAQALIGHALGAGRADRARALTRLLIRWGAGYGLLTGVLLVALAPLAVPLLTPDPDVRAALGTVVLIMAALQPAAGVVFLLDGVLIGAGDAAYLAWAGLASTVVFVAFALPVAWLHWSVTMLWLAVASLIAARLVFLVARARGTTWMRLGVPESAGGQ